MAGTPDPPVERSTGRSWGRWFKLGADELVKGTVLGLLSLAGIAGAWLWGWLAAGGPASAFGTVPPDAVMTFNASQCPAGWEPFAQAMGRTIVGGTPVDWKSDQLGDDGVALQRRTIGKTVGSETYKLLPENIPPLLSQETREISVSKGPAEIFAYAEVNEYSKIGQPRFISIPNTAVKGIPIMPPFIALLYCRKK